MKGKRGGGYNIGQREEGVEEGWLLRDCESKLPGSNPASTREKGRDSFTPTERGHEGTGEAQKRRDPGPLEIESGPFKKITRH